MITNGAHITDEIQISEDVLGFLDAMTAGGYMDAGDLLLFLEKPWKWVDEFALWLNNGKPVDPAEDDYQCWVDLMEDR